MRTCILSVQEWRGNTTDTCTCCKVCRRPSPQAHRLDLVLALDQQIKQLLGVHCGLAVIGHQPNERSVPPAGWQRQRGKHHSDNRPLQHCVLAGQGQTQKNCGASPALMWKLTKLTISTERLSDGSLVGDLGEGGGARGHEHLAHAILKGLEALIVHTQERLQQQRSDSSRTLSGRGHWLHTRRQRGL